MSRSGEGRRRGRLARGGDFDRVYREGRSRANRYVVLYTFPRGDDESAKGEVRLGVSVSRKVGDAVARNAVKRSLREAFWGLGDLLPARHDFVLVARPDAAALVKREGTRGLAAALRELVASSGLEGTDSRETQGLSDDG